jgi:hypothetical protein
MASVMTLEKYFIIGRDARSLVTAVARVPVCGPRCADVA